MNRVKDLALMALMVVVLVLIGTVGFQQVRKVTSTESTAEFPNDPNAPGAADYYGPQDKRFQDRTCTPEPMLSETFDESMVVKSKTATDDMEEECTTEDPEPKSGWDCDITPLPKEDSGPPEGFDPDKFYEDDQF
ncbi:hypothetical protein J5500_03715 [Candidatus Saccharibacteria bacterium]|nr:hypothetical protein [Candidatus Saccharibacteria bacterium]